MTPSISRSLSQSWRAIASAGLLWLTVTAAMSQAAVTEPKDSTLETLARAMVGVYSSQEQAKKDPENYKDIRLHMVRIWSERKDGPWLYIEQAVAGRIDKPYRQRVYHLVARPDGTVASEVYTLPGQPLAHAGDWQKPLPLADVKPEALSSRAGCSVILHRETNGTWTGATAPRGCPSDMHGAAYATSQVTLTDKTLESWDRGFDEHDKQVWGATEGPYIFRKELK